MTGGFVLPDDLLDEIDGILARLQQKTQADCVLLPDISGRLISTQGRVKELDPVILSALTASNMAATAEIARQIGEKNPFKLLFQEGERQNIYLSTVGKSFLLVVIFDTNIQIGRVRLFTTQAVKQLLPLAGKFEALQSQPREAFDTNFADILASEMDTAFGNWEDL